jgi:hypothetical protein
MSDSPGSELVNVVIIALSARPGEVVQDVRAIESDEGARWYLQHEKMTAPQLHVLKILTEKVKNEAADIQLFDHLSAAESGRPDIKIFVVTSRRPNDVIKLIEESELSGRVIELYSQPFRPEELPESMRSRPAGPEVIN